jgi:hypothetical protein
LTLLFSSILAMIGLAVGYRFYGGPGLIIGAILGTMLGDVAAQIVRNLL